jgi:predicted nucleic acid-binding protein
LTNNSKTVAILVYLTVTKDERHEKWKTMVYDASLYRDWFKSYTVCKSKMVASHFLFFANNSKTVAILVYLTMTKDEKHEKWKTMVYDASLYRDWFNSYTGSKSAGNFM